MFPRQTFQYRRSPYCDFRGSRPRLSTVAGTISWPSEQLVFPEIKYDSVEKVQGMNITIVTTAKTDGEARELPALLDSLPQTCASS
jgi:large subunit ribosomal protein L5